MSDKKMPMCWKCVSKITKSNGDGSDSLVGCKEEPKIKSFAGAEIHCPLIFFPKNKVLIIISDGGVAQMEYKPDGIEVEIRDYDIQGADVFPEDRPDCKKDNEGDWYQEMIFPIEDIDLGSENEKVIEKDEPVKFINHYRCPDCNTEWQDEWHCVCDDECPICAVAYSPYKSEDINEQKTLTILYHDISYVFDDDTTINHGDCEYEHIHYMITEGMKEGELNKTDPKDENKTIRGYWRMI